MVAGRSNVGINPTAPDAEHHVHLVGVINTSMDSYFKSSTVPDVAAAVSKAREFVRGGASVVEIGGQSGSTFATRIDETEELARTLPYVEAICAEFPQLDICIDTFRAGVAKQAIRAGARWVNDVTAAAFDPDMAQVIESEGVKAVLMHLSGAGGRAGRMLNRPFYADVVSEVCDYLTDRAGHLMKHGVVAGNIILDPGLGAGKHPVHDYELLSGIDRVVDLGHEVMVGPSRKFFIKAVDPAATTDDLIGGSIAAATWVATRGVRYLRVHEAKPYAQALDVWNAITRNLVTGSFEPERAIDE